MAKTFTTGEQVNTHTHNTLFLGISGPSGSHILGKIVEVLANFIECMISLSEKPESFQRLLLDPHSHLLQITD
jgi:hypothetical protein